MTETELYFNGWKVPKVLSYSADRNTRNTRTEYNANGDLLIDLVSRKYTLTVYLGRLSGEEMKRLLQETEPVFFTAAFYSPVYGEVQRSFHLAEQPAEIEYEADGKPVYGALKLVLEEQ